MSQHLPLIYLARHGETEWSLSGQHTGRTDIALTARGEVNAKQLGDRLKGMTFAQVISSPLQRAAKTCELSGFGSQMKTDPDLMEWDYGEYEGIKTVDIHQTVPGWNVFLHGCPGGESPEEIGARADRIVRKLRLATGNILIYSHGHYLRVLAARWLGLPARDGRLFLLSTASLSVLGYEHKNIQEPAIKLWNDDRHVTYG